MKKMKKTIIVAQNLMVDDYIKVAGVLYRIEEITTIPNAYLTIQLHNARRPLLKALINFDSNTLMKIWNQK